jgi:DNA-binding MarR family transcriptional regulator
MTATSPSYDRTVAELIHQLGRLAYGEGFVAGLTAAQWTTLRYFARANRFSRTVSAFADFHATTRGTASQTIKSLVTQGYLSRTRSTNDGRSTRLDVTTKGHRILSDDPFEGLVQAVAAVSPGVRPKLATSLERMLGHLARAQGNRPFGTCPTCKHLISEGSCPQDQPPYMCGLVGEPLAERELAEICVNFEPGRTSAMRRTLNEGSPR